MCEARPARANPMAAAAGVIFVDRQDLKGRTIRASRRGDDDDRQAISALRNLVAPAVLDCGIITALIPSSSRREH